MKKPLLLGLLLLLGVVRAAWAGAGPCPPADTLPGQARLVRHLSADMCERFATELKDQDVNKLSADECKALLGKLMLSSMADNVTDFQAMAQQPGSPGANELGQRVGQQVMLQLIENCPAARPLVMRMGMLSNGMSADLEPAERGILLPIVQSICKRMDEANAQQPLARRTPAQRNALLQAEMQGALLANAGNLTGYYGEEALENPQLSQQIGQKIGLLMVEQCPHYLMQAAQDATPAKSPPAAPPKAAPTPAKKSLAHPAPRHPAKK